MYDIREGVNADPDAFALRKIWMRSVRSLETVEIEVGDRRETPRRGTHTFLSLGR